MGEEEIALMQGCRTEQKYHKSETEYMSDACLEFVVFCIESLAEKLLLTGDAIYKKLAEQSDILDSYIIPSYDVLHTQGKEYIVNDILEVMRKRGVV